MAALGLGWEVAQADLIVLSLLLFTINQGVQSLDMKTVSVWVTMEHQECSCFSHVDGGEAALGKVMCTHKNFPPYYRATRKELFTVPDLVLSFSAPEVFDDWPQALETDSCSQLSD
jgi:hypothetical protein